MTVEHRQHPRRKTFKTGKIIYHNGLLSQPCLVRNISVGGAKLQIDPPFECPEQFLLELLNQPPRSCRVVWKKGETIGVQFSQPVAAETLPARIAAWKAAWESGDPAQVAALYAADCRHKSPKVRDLYPERAETGLVGTEDLRTYAESAFQKLTSLAFEVVTLTETENRSVIEYDRYSDQDVGGPVHVVEIIEWADTLIREARVFHA